MDKLPADIRREFESILERRFFSRCVDYQYKEMMALAEGVASQNVKVKQFPPDVEKAFASATQSLLEEEAKKGPDAKKAVDQLTEFMKKLSYW